MPTILSLLTPEYQQRFVQQMYHKVNSNAAQFSLMFCRPEGLLRWWSGPGAPSQLDVTVVPGRVQFLGGTDNAMRHVQIDRAFNLKSSVPNLGAEVPSWLGETVGFWDGETLISWTSNIQGWFTHGSWEYSNRMQVIEIWTPRHFPDGRFAGLEHEASSRAVAISRTPRRSASNTATRRSSSARTVGERRSRPARPSSTRCGISTTVPGRASGRSTSRRA
jgi:hypothetical protein